MPTLALTIGDPTGIGPEITAKALQQLAEFPHTKFIVIGAVEALEQTVNQLGLTLPRNADISYRPIT